MLARIVLIARRNMKILTAALLAFDAVILGYDLLQIASSYHSGHEEHGLLTSIGFYGSLSAKEIPHPYFPSTSDV